MAVKSLKINHIKNQTRRTRKQRLMLKRYENLSIGEIVNYFFKMACITMAFMTSTVALSATLSPYTKITTIEVHDWAGIIIHLEDQAVKNEGCGFQSSLRLKQDHYLFNTAYSTILSALHSNSDIRFFVDGCEDHGDKTIPIIKRIDIKGR